MDLLHRFKEFARQQQLFAPTDHLLLAVSGGIDSVVLCELCRQANYSFTIAHCNFQLRGLESQRDEDFVRSLGKKYGVEVLVRQFDTSEYATQQKISIQEAARELRYTWFATILEAKDTTASLLLTAHHADDNIETTLMHFFRGTGLRGLTGIPARNGLIRRPLLNFYKEELIGFANENKLDFVEDSSNESSKYTRNFFRNEIIPAVSNVFPQVKENLAGNIRRFSTIATLYEQAVNNMISKLGRQKGNEWHVPIKQLMLNRALVYEVIHRFGFEEKQVDELYKLAASESGKFIISRRGDNRIIRHRHWFIIGAVKKLENAHFIIEEEDKVVEFSDGKLAIDQQAHAPATIPSSTNEAWVDGALIRFPLLLRRWKEGDYFYPLGMKKKKKIARFLIDRKLSKTEKENCWVVESNKKIIWVVGQRIDERFKITEKTKNVLRLQLAKG